MWLLINLSKEYQTVINYKLSYNHLANNKVYKKEPLQELPITIKGNGFKLFMANFKTAIININLNNLQHKKNTEYFILTNSLKPSIQNQLNSGLQIEYINLDTLKIHLGTLSSKKVALKPQLDISFSLGYNLANPITVIPDSITISGLDEELNSLTHLNLTPIQFENLQENKSIETSIIKPTDLNSIKLHHLNTKINIEVDKFTEGSFDVPIEVINIPKNIQLSIFPKKITIKCKIGLQNFNKVTANSFKIVADYNKTILNENSFLIPELVEKSNLVSSVRISPNKIDFLINK